MRWDRVGREEWGRAWPCTEGNSQHIWHDPEEEARMILTEASMSLRVLPAGMCAILLAAFLGTGITSEQSVRRAGMCPRTASLAMTFSNFLTMAVWSSIAQGCELTDLAKLQLRVLTDEGLPFTGGSGVASNSEIGLQTEFTRQWGQGLTRFETSRTGGSGTFQERL